MPRGSGRVRGVGPPDVSAGGTPVRLQKIIAAAGVASRRAAEDLIRQGRVSVNGVTVTGLGTKADPDQDDIRVDGRRVRPARRLRYILLHKPRRVVTTRRDPQQRRTVMDLLTGVREPVYPVGRLDYDSEGLLLLTNDGDLAARLTHPRHGVVKRYRVLVRGVPDEDALDVLRRGVVIEGERTGPADVRVLGKPGGRRTGESTWLEIAIGEGRNRQVRRMCQAIGHPVLRLQRVAIGPLTARGLRPGEWRDLTPDEVEALRHIGGHTTHGPRRRPGP